MMHSERSLLFTDLYQLTMMQGYFSAGIGKQMANFDVFFRKNPYSGGFSVFSGLSDVVEFLESAKFDAEEINYLRSLKLFSEDFLERLSKFRFSGDLYSVDEGTVVFPQEPVMRIVAPLDESQLVETAILNFVNFQTLIATKAARICQIGGFENVMEFGLRRAQGLDGGLTASKAAYIGGCIGTSNVKAGQKYGIPVKGTHAHAWVTAFPDEITAFRKFVEVFPNNSILLVDTFNTLNSGVPNAIQVGLEMKKRGQVLMGIRLDSGDLSYLSSRAREMLDAAGLTETKIVASNELDEYIIGEMVREGGKVDIYGVGTRLVTGSPDASLSGVYKLSALETQSNAWIPKIKLAEGSRKSNLPGRKQVWRLLDSEGGPMADLVDLEYQEHDWSQGILGVHPQEREETKVYHGIKDAVPLLTTKISKGKIVWKQPSLDQIREKVKKEVLGLHPSFRRLLNPHIYKVSLGPSLAEMTYKLRNEI